MQVKACSFRWTDWRRPLVGGGQDEESAKKRTQASASQREGAHTSVLSGKILCDANRKEARVTGRKRLKQSTVSHGSQGL